jgi:DNA-binding SARP family transcriptional activator/tetratricopeptide (TPR) repeat protein
VDTDQDRGDRPALVVGMFGGLEIRLGDMPVPVGHARQKAVLAALLVDANRVVSADGLIDRIWADRAPARARSILRTYLSHLRRALAPTGITVTWRDVGYLLSIDADVVDMHRSRRLLDQARKQQDPRRAVALAQEALALWRGEPLVELDSPWAQAVRERLRHEHAAAESDRIDWAMQCGSHHDLVPELTARAARHPLDERVAGQLILALYRSGRQADALQQYQRTRGQLAEDLGTDPAPELRDLHQRILTADPTLATGHAAVEEGASTVTPRQLPVAPALFVGRQEELDRLDLTLTGATAKAAAVVISAVSGAGGIGKTWLALHWAHHHLDRFPDGQLFVDLRGFSPTDRPAHPVEVLGGFLEALSVDRDRQPADLDRRAELYRSLIADKRMLVMLDNAAATDQVVPLLPGGRHCTVVITSRNHLRGLAARHGARPIHLDVLTNAEAHTLLATALSRDRPMEDVQAISTLIELCGGFPLALGLITARAADSHLPLGDTVAELRTLGLEALDSEDPTASLPAVLSWSLGHLTDQQRQVFALLGIAPGPDTGLPAATALTGLPERETHAVLRALADASLIDRVPGGRYGMHDLVRAYAVSVADNSPDDLPAELRETALRRVLDYYTHTAHTADQLLNPHRDPAPFDPPSPEIHLHALTDAPAALTWFDTEHASLLAAQHTATTFDWHATVWKLAWSLHTFQYRWGHLHDELTVWQAAADAAPHLPDPTTHTLAHQYLGRAHADQGHHEDAIAHLRQALNLAEHHHDLAQQAHTHNALGWAWERRGDDRKALDHARRALNLYRSLDQPVREARALNAVGWCAARVGDYDTGREHCQAALALYRHHHIPEGEAATLDSLGYIDHHSGRRTEAIDHYRHALTLFRDLSNPYEAANTLDRLGHPHAALGRTEQARTVWREALQLYREQGRHDDAARVQQQLDDLEHNGDQPPETTT